LIPTRHLWLSRLSLRPDSELAENHDSAVKILDEAGPAAFRSWNES
jgi:hypothetical protein